MSLNSFVSMLDKKMCLLSLNSLDTRVSLMERSSVAESPTGTETALGWKIPMVTQGIERIGMVNGFLFTI